MSWQPPSKQSCVKQFMCSWSSLCRSVGALWMSKTNKERMACSTDSILNVLVKRLARFRDGYSSQWMPQAQKSQNGRSQSQTRSNEPERTGTMIMSKRFAFEACNKLVQNCASKKCNHCYSTGYQTNKESQNKKLSTWNVKKYNISQGHESKNIVCKF